MNTHGPQLYQGSPGSENVLSAGPQVTRAAEGQAPLLEMNPLELTEVTPPSPIPSGDKYSCVAGILHAANLKL